MIYLVLVRHGNTFGPEDKVVWAGARTDLPLVEAGYTQANTLGRYFGETYYVPDVILTGPLLRTRQHTDILAKHIGIADEVEIHQALCEIDYGTWEGLSTEEIHAIGGEAELDTWNTKGKWPKSPGWTPPAERIQNDIADLLAHLMESLDGHGHIMAVTSNGILRFLARQCVNPPPLDQQKVRTGHYCQLSYDGQLRQISWNRSPDTPLAPFATT